MKIKKVDIIETNKARVRPAVKKRNGAKIPKRRTCDAVNQILAVISKPLISKWAARTFREETLWHAVTF